MTFLWMKRNRQLHEHVPLICLKLAIYDKSVQLREFDDSDVEHTYEQDSHKKVGEM